MWRRSWAPTYAVSTVATCFLLSMRRESATGLLDTLSVVETGVARLRQMVYDAGGRMGADVGLPEFVQVPVRGYVPAGELWPEEEQPMRSEPIRAELVNGIARPFALVVNGDSMAGELEPGDL